MMTAKRHYQLETEFANPPGDTLAETLEALGMSQKELATRTGLTPQTINRIIGGTHPISVETARRLELATDVPARLWNNLETRFRERLARQAETEELEADLEWLETCKPIVSELKKRGVVTARRDRVAQLRQVLGFFGVSSVRAFHDYWDERRIAARKTEAFESHEVATAAWIRFGERQAREIDCHPYDADRFREAVDRIRELTVDPPESFVPKMRQWCAEAGVALCLVRGMPKAPWYGATRWLTPDKAMILLGRRGKWTDQFWFSFFHEAGHVLFDAKKEIYLSESYGEDPREDRANRFALDTLVPPDVQDEIPSLRSRKAVRALAERLGIHPGIIVGQFQRMTENWGWMNDLRGQYRWEG